MYRVFLYKKVFNYVYILTNLFIPLDILISAYLGSNIWIQLTL